MSEHSTAANPTLHVVFAGLCMLVRDEANEQLHVLLPTNHEHAAHDEGNETHEAWLIHDVAYGCTGTATDQMCKRDLNGMVLDLRNLGGEKPLKLKVDEVVDEGCIGGTPVAHEHLTSMTPTKLVKSRVSLASGNEGGNKGRGGVWKLGACPEQKMAIWVEWLIRPTLVNGQVELAIHENGTAGTLKLVPPANGHIYLFVLNVPHWSVPETLPKFPFEPSNKIPGYNTEARHFRAFYPLVNLPADKEGPVYKGDEGGAVGEPSGKPSGEPRGFDYGCMMATVRAAS